MEALMLLRPVQNGRGCPMRQHAIIYNIGLNPKFKKQVNVNKKTLDIIRNGMERSKEV